ncbi:GNAT family N-acetyltransferase [Embleya sp. NPDC050493]|uniref:GNAT family N-acetyltransferase n=1 Tax=Embleya sp. NPDC050493 TaxID=3363989 RepID=UPI0037911508
MGKTVVYLEMTSLDDLRPSRSVPALALRRVDAATPMVQALQARVGASYGWRSASRTEHEWAELHAAHPLRQPWLVTHAGETAGIGNLEPQPGGNVEVVTFGLLPEFVGKGLGGYALTLLLRQAWHTTPLSSTEPVRRVWLHTSSEDHPNALVNYRARGLRPYGVEARA